MAHSKQADPVGAVRHEAVLNSFYYRDLTRDVASTDADNQNNDPNPRFARADADEIIQGCEAFGNVYKVQKTAGGWVPIQKFHVFSRMKAELQELVDSSGPDGENEFCTIGHPANSPSLRTTLTIFPKASDNRS